MSIPSSPSISDDITGAPTPIAVIRVPISSLLKTLSSLAFWTFITFPFNGRTACVFLSLPCLAEPPADSPSTIKSSDFSGSFSWQSANFPGNEPKSRALFLLVKSLAFFAASLALAASIDFPTIFLAWEGFF